MTTLPPIDRVVGSLLGGAIGDALVDPTPFVLAARTEVELGDLITRVGRDLHTAASGESDLDGEAYPARPGDGEA